MSLKDSLKEAGIVPGGQLIIEKITQKTDLKWLQKGYAIEFIEIDGEREVISFFLDAFEGEDYNQFFKD